MTTLPKLPCYLNGDYTDLAHAKISVMDRGFIFGDGVYEVVPVYAGQLFRFEEHMARLERSLAEVRIDNPMTRHAWHAVAHQLIAAYSPSSDGPASDGNQLIYIQITRGVAMRDHAMPRDLTPTVFVMTSAMRLPAAAQREHGVTCVSADDFRWEKAHIKSVSLLGSVFARQISVDSDAAETIMFRRGFLSEASASNVWVVKNSSVFGPPRDHLVLAGIRYGLIESICRAQGLDFELRRIPRSEVFEADELILSSATKEVLAVTTLDGKAVGTGLPGPVYRRLLAGYQSAIQQAQASAKQSRR